MKLRYGLFSLAAVIALGACASGGGGGGGEGGGALEQAMAELRGGDQLEQGERPRENDFTDAAEEQLEQAREAETPEAGAPFFRAAVEAAQAAINADSTNPLGYRLAGEAYLGLDDYEMAGDMLDRAEELRPVYVLETERIRETAWLDRYQAAAPLVNSGDYEGAIEIYEQANAIYQGRPEVMITLGQVYQALGEHDKAIENLQAAQDLIESDRTAQMDEATAAGWREQGAMLPTYIAQSLVAAGRYEEATTALRGLLEEDPGNVAYLQSLANAFVRMEQPDSATAVYNEVLALDGLTSDQLYRVGVGFYQIEDYVGAADAFKAAATASVNDRDALELWARSLLIEYPAGEGEPEIPAEALADLDEAATRWLELDPYSQNAHIILAQTVNREGDEGRASELVEAIEGLQVTMDNLQLQRGQGGGGAVVGTMTNKSLDAGTPITVEVTFYDAAGTVLATETTTVSAPAADASAQFRVGFPGDAYIGGYGYTLSF